jgi:hypothetical protein
MGTGKARAVSRFHRLRTLRVFGGFLDGLELHFPAGLTCLIGGRGAGKTTVLELIRYALDQLPNRERDPAGSKRARELIDQNLRGGQVELEIETREGLVYRVRPSRRRWRSARPRGPKLRGSLPRPRRPRRRRWPNILRLRRSRACRQGGCNWITTRTGWS